jgi:hypothetical protein
MATPATPGELTEETRSARVCQVIVVGELVPGREPGAARDHEAPSTNTPELLMRRRDVIRALTAGLALPTIDALTPDTMWASARAIHHRIRRIQQDQELLVLTEHQNAMVSALAELIIPETDTPGATAARVNRFVDVMLAEWFDEDAREAFLRGLVALDARSVNTFGTPFLGLDEAQQTVLLHGLDAELAALRQAGLPTGDHFFQRMKWLTLFGYYTSEVGATQELEQVIVPGRYDPCGPVRREASGQWE